MRRQTGWLVCCNGSWTECQTAGLKCLPLLCGQIANGPQVVLRLRAHVTMPDMEISDDVLEFHDVKCGECRVITVQIHNHQHVRCDWFSGQTDEEKRQVRPLVHVVSLYYSCDFPVFMWFPCCVSLFSLLY